MALGDRLSPGVRQDVTFHAFRGAFKGDAWHDQSDSDQHRFMRLSAMRSPELDDRYIGEITIEETYPEVHGCRYNGLTLPTL